MGSLVHKRKGEMTSYQPSSWLLLFASWSVVMDLSHPPSRTSTVRWEWKHHDASGHMMEHRNHWTGKQRLYIAHRHTRLTKFLACSVLSHVHFSTIFLPFALLWSSCEYYNDDSLDEPCNVADHTRPSGVLIRLLLIVPHISLFFRYGDCSCWCCVQYKMIVTDVTNTECLNKGRFNWVSALCFCWKQYCRPTLTNRVYTVVMI